MIINIIVQTDDDKKFVNWLDMNLTNYFSYIDLKNIKKDNISHDDTDNNMIANETSNDLGNNINSNNKHKVRTLKSNNKKGFTSIYFITLVIVGAIVLGIAIANIMIR